MFETRDRGKLSGAAMKLLLMNIARLSLPCLVSAVFVNLTPPSGIRRNILDMPAGEQQRYYRALLRLNRAASSPLETEWMGFATNYANSEGWGDGSFLRMNRIYLAAVESALAKSAPGTTIPYWVPGTNDTYIFSEGMFGSIPALPHGYSLNRGCTMDHDAVSLFYQDQVHVPECMRPFPASLDTSGGRVAAHDLDFYALAEFHALLRSKFVAVAEAIGSQYRLPRAAYGPLFLSHIAYIDAIWTLGSVHEDNYLLKPRRYVHFLKRVQENGIVSDNLPGDVRIVYPGIRETLFQQV